MLKRLAIAALVILMTLALAGSARADLILDQVAVELNQPPEMENEVPKVNPDGTFVDPRFDRQAGGHPDFSFYFKVHPRQPDGAPSEAVRSLLVDLPPGMIGDPTGIPTCSPAALSSPGAGGAKCPVESQIGVAEVRIWGPGGPTDVVVGIFNISHGSDVPARFGLNYAGVIGLISTSVNPKNYSIGTGSLSISQGEAVESIRVTIWGVPAEPSHDSLRQGLAGSIATQAFNTPGKSSYPSASLPTPLLTAPPRCSPDPLKFTIRANSWENPGRYDEETVTADADGTPFLMSGCERVPFEPGTDVTPSTHAADTPTGLDVGIDIHQLDDPHGIASAHLRKVKTALPEGMRVNASSVAGLGSCTQSQVKLGTKDSPACPDSSKLGTVDLETPMLDQELHGDIFLASQNDNPFNSLLALYIVVKGPGFYLKLPGEIETDLSTGRVTIVFDDIPQLPFAHLRLSLNGGPRAVISTPRGCGTYSMRTEFTSWKDDDPVVIDSPIQINQGCDVGGFSPGFEAGTVDPTAGAHSPFILRIIRENGEDDLSRLKATLPEGLVGKLAGVPLCGSAQAATGDCPASSQVGQVTVGAGSGPLPLYVPEPGKAPAAAYLAGPYEGAPYSMVVKVPVQGGPFDLGTIAVRNALRVDPATAQVTAVSDPLPRILEGIPIAYRDIRVELDRPDFTVNPTSCKQMAVTSVLTSATGQTASPSSPFRASGCGQLGFEPKIEIAFKGKTHRSAHPAVKATLTMPKGEANLGKAAVLMPPTEFIDNAHIANPCTMVQFDAGDCPAGSILGQATAYTPLLDQPLTGPIYFRANGGARKLPDLAADLNGPIHLDVVGFIDSIRTGPETGRVRVRFRNVPDAAVSKFVIKLKGGGRGLLVNNTELCKAKPRATAKLTGQNGKVSTSNPLIRTSCGKSRRKPK